MIKARKREDPNGKNAPAISIIGAGVEVVGDITSPGTIRIEGRVQGAVRAGKAVVVGKDGVIEGDLTTQDAVLSGRITGTVVAASRLELQASCRIDGAIHTRRLQLEEGAVANGRIHMGEEVTLEELDPGGESPELPAPEDRAMVAAD